jgi:hypothetical protein
MVNEHTIKGILLVDADEQPDNHVANHHKSFVMLTIILIIAALICFAVFFKSIDFFDKI